MWQINASIYRSIGRYRRVGATVGATVSIIGHGRQADALIRHTVVK